MLTLAGIVNSTAQESTKPLTDVEIERKCCTLDIEGKTYNDVVVTMKSITPDYFITDKYKVKITVKDSNGKKVWSKTLKQAFLYVFSNGQVQIGRPNFDQVVLAKYEYSDCFYGKIREKEGIY